MAETTKKRGRKKEDVETKTIVEPIQETVKDADPEIVSETVPEIKETVEQLEVKETAKETETSDVISETVVETETVIEKKPAPKKKTEKKETAKTEYKKPKIAVGATYTLPFARLYASSVAKKPICVCSGETVIISTDVHDGRINVNNLGTGFVGWIDVTEIK